MSGSFRNSCDVFRLPLFIQHFLNSFFSMGNLPGLKYVCFYSNLQVRRLDASFWLKLSYWVKTDFVNLLSSSATRLIGLKKRLMASKTAPMQCNASQCDWTFSLGISVEIQFLSAWCSWDAPALWSICIWIIGSSWYASILPWFVKTVHYSERDLLKR